MQAKRRGCAAFGQETQAGDKGAYQRRDRDDDKNDKDGHMA